MYKLYLVTDEGLSLGRPVTDIVAKAVKGGVDAVQLREKNKNTRDFIALAEKVKNILQPYNVPLIINDRLDVALAAGADGIHIGQQDMPYKKAKALMPAGTVIGLSVENTEQAKEAEKLDVDYLGVSPVYPTPTKTDIQTTWGIEGVRELRKITRHQLIAIGSIKTHNATEIIRAGANGIAVVSGICSAGDPEAAARELLNIVNKAKNE